MTTPPPIHPPSASAGNGNTGNIWDGVRMARHFMIVGLAVMFVAQFFLCSEGESYGVLTVGPDYGTHGTYWFSWMPTGSGWTVHPLAPLVFIGLGFAYFTTWSKTPGWRKWGYWVSLGLGFLCLSPGAWTTTGFKIALAGYGLMIWGAVQNHKDRKIDEANNKTAV